MLNLSYFSPAFNCSAGFLMKPIRLIQSLGMVSYSIKNNREEISMESEQYVSKEQIQKALSSEGFKESAVEGRLMLAEMILKAAAGYRNSCTEEAFMSRFPLLKKDRTPNKLGRKFLCSIFYNHSNRKPECFELIQAFRR